MRFVHYIGLLLVASGVARAGTLTPELSAQMAARSTRQAPVPVIAYLTDAAPPGAYPVTAAIAARKARAHATQGPLVSALTARGATKVRPLWVINAVAFEAPPQVVRAVAGRPDVRLVAEDPVSTVPTQPGRQMTGGGGGAAAVNWNISKIGADQVWAQGIRGNGIRVGIIDSGVDAAHPALTGKMAAGGWYDAVSGLPNPYDDNGHGTHVTGIIVGGVAAGASIGVAPDAKYLMAKALNAANAFQFSWVLAAGQWLLDPNRDGSTSDAPDIINCSWAFSIRTASDYHSMLELWRAAGILPVFAIGNQGPNSDTSGSPGSDPLVFGVGSTNAYDTIAESSGRGPAPAGWPFNGIMKPDLVAPGVNITSAAPGGGTRSMSGTSMASPHVAGALALMRQKFPGITYAAAYQRLTGSAVDLGAAGPDTIYGYGRVNIPAAFQAVVVIGDTDGNGVVTPADAVMALRIAGGMYANQAAAGRADIAQPIGRVTVADAVAILRVYNGG